MQKYLSIYGGKTKAPVYHRLRSGGSFAALPQHLLLTSQTWILFTTVCSCCCAFFLELYLNSQHNLVYVRKIFAYSLTIVVPGKLHVGTCRTDWVQLYGIFNSDICNCKAFYSKIYFDSLTFHLLILCVFCGEWTHTCHGIHVGVRKQSIGVDFLYPRCRSFESNIGCLPYQKILLPASAIPLALLPFYNC